MAYPALMLLAIACSICTQSLFCTVVAALFALSALTWRHRDIALNLANAVTWMRILATAGLALLPGYSVVLVASLILILDGVDGAIARARGTTSVLGASLDKECDAFFVCVVAFLLWRTGTVGGWVLSAGIWRYAYGMVVSLPGVRLKTAPRSNWSRSAYLFACVCLILSLVPLIPLAIPLSALACIAISVSFIRSLYYSL